MTTALGAVSDACRARLTIHYGNAVANWLDAVPYDLTMAAQRWQLSLVGYHDAGHASVLARGVAEDGAPVMVKAWFDRERYRHETAALTHWAPINGRVIRGRDDERALACLDLVGGSPGGQGRPQDDPQQVAHALARLHQAPPLDHDFSNLDEYLATDVQPRMRRRAQRFGAGIPLWCLETGLQALEQRQVPGPCVLLHADLYRENVPVGERGPVFLDPLPVVGSALFDWAFFVVYFVLTDDPALRLRIAAAAAAVSVDVLLPWCLMLCLDGLLYYHEVGDAREQRMIEVMAMLAAQAKPA